MNDEAHVPPYLPVTDLERRHYLEGRAVRPEVVAAMHPADHVDELWQKIPEHLREGLRSYLMEYRRPGSFLCSVLENDLHGALMRCDWSLACIRDICLYLYNCAPAGSYGSRDEVDAWCAKLVRLRLEESFDRTPFDGNPLDIYSINNIL